MNILIIEDEKAVSNDLLQTIKKILNYHSKLEIRQVYSVRESITYLQSTKIPDLIFSDIQLGDGVCFDIFRQIEIITPIIFCTAYDEYAIQAFKTNGIEYILKPFIAETVKNALKKYENLNKMFSPQKRPFDYESIIELLGRQSGDNRVASVLVYSKEEIIPVKLEEIALFFLEDNDTFLLTLDGRRYFPNKSLDELEKITGDYFFRANRQFLVSRPAVSTAYSFFSRKLALKLCIPFDGQIIVSKEKKKAFLEWLSFSKF